MEARLGAWPDVPHTRIPALPSFRCTHAPPLPSTAPGLAGHYRAPWMLLAARFLTGVGATNAVTSRTYLVRVTTPRMRTTAMAASNGLQVRQGGPPGRP